MEINYKSESINELSKALSITQGQIEGASKDSNNPFFKSKYADLRAVWDACREPLSKNNLAVIQTVRKINNDLFLVSTLTHSSGQWIESYYPIITQKIDPQSLGSCVTYARRYSLAALIGVYQEDDDGEKAMVRPQAQAPKIESKPLVEVKKDPPKKDLTDLVTQDQIKRLMAIANENHWKDAHIKAFILEKLNKNSKMILTKKEYEKLCSYIQTHPNTPLEGDFSQDSPSTL